MPARMQRLVTSRHTTVLPSYCSAILGADPSTRSLHRLRTRFGRVKLRVESGYCASLLKVMIEATKSLTDLCLGLEVRSSDHVAAACKGLALVNPERLIILDPENKRNRKAQQFMNAVLDSVGEWNKLVRCSISAFSP